MYSIEWIRFIIGALLLLAGIVFYIIQFIGVFRFKYVMNRMHAAAIGDTLGSGLMLLGTVVLNGFQLSTLKIIIIIIGLWLTAPVSSHMLGKLEVLHKEEMTEVCRVATADELNEEAQKEEEEA